MKRNALLTKKNHQLLVIVNKAAGISWDQKDCKLDPRDPPHVLALEISSSPDVSLSLCNGLCKVLSYSRSTKSSKDISPTFAANSCDNLSTQSFGILIDEAFLQTVVK